MHGTVPAAAQPAQQVRLGLAQFDIGDADLLKTQLATPSLDVGGEPDEINMMAISRDVHEGLSYTYITKGRIDDPPGSPLHCRPGARTRPPRHRGARHCRRHADAARGRGGLLSVS